MYKKITFLFLFFLLLYIPFSRTPDFFEGKITTAIVQKTTEKSGAANISAFFTLNGKDTFSYNPSYLFRSFRTGEKIKTIYATSNPNEAALYSFWGYWIGWQEVLALVTGYVALFLIALAVTHNPSDEALKEMKESAKPQMRKPRYDV